MGRRGVNGVFRGGVKNEAICGGNRLIPWGGRVRLGSGLGLGLGAFGLEALEAGELVGVFTVGLAESDFVVGFEGGERSFLPE